MTSSPELDELDKIPLSPSFLDSIKEENEKERDLLFELTVKKENHNQKLKKRQEEGHSHVTRIRKRKFKPNVDTVPVEQISPKRIKKMDKKSPPPTPAPPSPEVQALAQALEPEPEPAESPRSPSPLGEAPGREEAEPAGENFSTPIESNDYRGVSNPKPTKLTLDDFSEMDIPKDFRGNRIMIGSFIPIYFSAKERLIIYKTNYTAKGKPSKKPLFWLYDGRKQAWLKIALKDINLDYLSSHAFQLA